MTNNALKAISRTDDQLRVGNHIVLFGGRDLEGAGNIHPSGTGPMRKNADGSIGEFFTKNTQLESIFTRLGTPLVNWEHAQAEAGDDVLGMVDWKTAKIDDKGVFVQRVLDRRNQYVQWLDELGWFDDGTVGTSSQAIPGKVRKADNGEITIWPLEADTITVSPMEPRNLNENQLRAFKALGIPVPDDTPEPEAAPEADTSAVAVATANVNLFLLELDIEQE